MMSRISTILCLLALMVSGPLLGREAPLVAGLDDLKELDRQLISMAPNAQEATVALVSRGGRGSGSGVIVSADGLVLTAAHVMASLSDDVIVILADGRRLNAKKLGADFDRDAGLVQITDEGPFVFAEMGDRDSLRRNDWCVAAGHPGGYDPTRKPPFRLGRVLSSGNFIETDCAVVGGDSGGPLFDPAGRVVGIHSNIGMSLTQNRHVPIAVFRDQWEALQEGRRQGSRFAGRRAQRESGRPVLGVGVIDSTDGGAEVTRVLPGSPAAEAGIQVADVIVSVGDREIEDRRSLIETMSRFKAGKKVELRAYRNGEERSFEVKLIRREDLDDGDEGRSNPEDEELAPEEAEPEAAAPADEADTSAELDHFLEKQLDGAKNGALRLQLTPDKIEQFGGMEKIMDRLKEMIRERREAREAEEPPASDDAEPSKEKEAAEDAKPAAEQADDAADEVEELTDEKARELLKQAMKNGGKLQMDNEEAKRFGGADAVSRRLAEMMRSMKPEEMREFLTPSEAATMDEFFASSMEALRPVVRKNRGATVEVLVEEKPVALGTIVDERGWFMTKDTETLDAKVQVRWRGKLVPARLLERFPRYDLALYAIKGKGFRPVKWVPSDQIHLGGLLATPGPDGEPMGIGMVSVLPRPLAEIGFLGIGTEAEGDRVLIGRVIDDSAAAEAGLEVGDQLVKLSGWEVTDRIAFSAKIREYRAGDEVVLEVRRDGEMLTIPVELGERPAGRQGRRFRRMNQMSGPMSERTNGFPEVLQHDIPLQPGLCGGPLLDLRGRCVGVNVSRAGRVKTYAIPGSVVRDLVAQVDSAAVTNEDLEAARALIREVRDQLSELEDRLEAMETR